MNTSNRTIYLLWIARIAAAGSIFLVGCDRQGRGQFASANAEAAAHIVSDLVEDLPLVPHPEYVNWS